MQGGAVWGGAQGEAPLWEGGGGPKNSAEFFAEKTQKFCFSIPRSFVNGGSQIRGGPTIECLGCVSESSVKDVSRTPGPRDKFTRMGDLEKLTNDFSRFD